MKRFRRFLMVIAVGATTLFSAASEDYTVVVDGEGVMRRGDTGEEVSFYGTNYTTPFAFAYRAMERLSIDHKSAIERDVYHMARLGFNGFRLHLWDVELSDSVGNLIENEHLDLLDYLISQLESRGIKIVLTAQTNFGNGYPERNTDPNGAFTYRYPKCGIHEDPEAIEAQERYLRQLLNHRNKYTGKDYVSDRGIIAVEVNNEPCHTGTEEVVGEYLSRMVNAIRSTGWEKPIFYNVSHNFDVTQAFFDADIEGTTYQWYPMGLVSGFTRRGNFLPYVDRYNISFEDSITGFDKKARIVYEYDPADNLYSYLHPAIARSFRQAGFQWVTQFAYDPTDIAWSNTEYQTHYLNLAYTPQKALSLMIAGEVMREMERGADYGSYPNDTIFGNFLVSGKRDLSVLNDGKKFIYTNSNEIMPKNRESLTQVAGYGNSTVVDYPGRGAYFLDKLSDGTWRLEVMPDVILVSDPFARPSLDKHVGRIFYRNHKIGIDLPELGERYYVKGINDGNEFEGRADGGAFSVSPGVYILSSTEAGVKSFSSEDRIGNLAIGEYVAPAAESENIVEIVHTPVVSIEEGGPLTIEATVASATCPDSVVVYPGSVSMWRERNRVFRMDSVGPYTYRAVIDTEALPRGDSDYGYDIVVFNQGERKTFPSGNSGTPLDWDFTGVTGGYRTHIAAHGSPIALVNPSNGFDGTEISTIPSRWRTINFNTVKRTPVAMDVLRLEMRPDTESGKVVLTKYVEDLLRGRHTDLESELVVRIGRVEGVTPETINIGIITEDGIAYTADVKVEEGEATVRLRDLKLGTTYLCPEPYPGFLEREFRPTGGFSESYNGAGIERLQIMIPKGIEVDGAIEIEGVYFRAYPTRNVNAGAVDF